MKATKAIQFKIWAEIEVQYDNGTYRSFRDSPIEVGIYDTFEEACDAAFELDPAADLPIDEDVMDYAEGGRVMDNSDREALKQMVDDYSLMEVLEELEEYCWTSAREYRAETRHTVADLWQADAEFLRKAIRSRAEQ